MNKINLLDQIGHVSAFLAVVAMTTYLLNFFVALVVRASAPALGLAPLSCVAYAQWANRPPDASAEQKP